MCLGEWLNGRVAVSKTVGCVFESRLPCHRFPTTIYCGRVFFFADILINPLPKAQYCPKSRLEFFAKNTFAITFGLFAMPILF